MKKYIRHCLLHLLPISFLMFVFAGCRKDHSSTRTYTIYTPVYQSKASALADINGNATQPITTAGKIYIKDNYIFINDVDHGIHVIDNRNPSSPVQTAFLKIPGNQDIAVLGNTLYADMYSDLLAIDISNIHQAKVTKVVSNTFQDRMYINGHYADSTQVFADWIKKDTTVSVEENSNQYPNQCDFCYFDLATASVKSSPTGVAGSMARMVILNNYMYALTEQHDLGVINLKNPMQPLIASNFFAGFDLETIYPFEGKLFLGSSQGMFMYDVSDPENPAQLGQFTHGTACDPVVADGKFAYVTLHAGTLCGGAQNELNVVNVEDLMNPFLVKSYTMTKPTGLCKDGNLLFVCDGNALKMYDATVPSALKLISQKSMTDPYDVIAENNKITVVAKDGIYQYEYSAKDILRRLSVIMVKS